MLEKKKIVVCFLLTFHITLNNNTVKCFDCNLLHEDELSALHCYYLSIFSQKASINCDANKKYKADNILATCGIMQCLREMQMTAASGKLGFIRAEKTMMTSIQGLS